MDPSEKVTLILGASDNPDRVSYQALISLRRRNIPVIAVGRKDCDLGDVKIVKGKPPVTQKVHTVTLYMSAANQAEFYDYILSLNPQRIIFNPGTQNRELADLVTIRGIEVVESCMLVMLKRGLF